LIRALIAAAGIAFALSAPAQDLRILGPAEPEAGFSVTARAVAKALIESGAAKKVDTWSAPGKGGLVGLTKFVKEAKGDPTQLMITGYTTLNSILMNKSPVTLADVTPIARLTADVSFAFLVPGDSPIKDARELAAMLKADPSRITWAAGSIGGAGQTAVVLFALAVGVDPSKLNTTVALAGSAIDAVAEGKVMVALGAASRLPSAGEGGAPAHPRHDGNPKAPGYPRPHDARAGHRRRVRELARHRRGAGNHVRATPVARHGHRAHGAVACMEAHPARKQLAGRLSWRRRVRGVHRGRTREGGTRRSRYGFRYFPMNS